MNRGAVVALCNSSSSVVKINLSLNVGNPMDGVYGVESHRHVLLSTADQMERSEKGQGKSCY